MFFIKRFFVHACAWAMAITALTAIAGCEQKQTAKDNDRLVLGMVLEPPGLDPTVERLRPLPKWCSTTYSRP